FGKGDQVTQDRFGTAQKFSLVQEAALAGAMRDMHETNIGGPLLPARPVKRVKIEEVAEVGAGGGRADRGQPLVPQVPGEVRHRNIGVETGSAIVQDLVSRMQRAGGVFSG